VSSLYAASKDLVKSRSRIPRLVTLVDGSRSFQVYLPPLTLHDPFADLRRGLTFLVLGIRVIQFLQAGIAAGTVRAFKATMQTVMSHPIAITITGLLMQHRRYLRSQVVSVRLIGKLRMDSDVSHVTTGFKSLLLKPLVPFFRKNNAGALVPIVVTGSPDNYDVKQNLLHRK